MNADRKAEVITYATKMHKLGRSHNPYKDKESMDLWQATWDKLCDEIHNPKPAFRRIEKNGNDTWTLFKGDEPRGYMLFESDAIEWRANDPLNKGTIDELIDREEQRKKDE